ncbi:hypothetical protein NVV90_12450 [Arthrobacter sp. CJ23]|nr:hypothetical protein [Arthrobacter sp. CJ23]UVJ38071.1 hypothetical protein NVV90_12450 [Arthrobacter sp. CJ23]
MTLLTGEHPSKVVAEYAVPLSSSSPYLKDRLNGEEEIWRDEGFVPPLVELAFVANEAGVVRVSQDLAELAIRYGLFGPSLRWPGCQTLKFQFLDELHDREFPRGVGLESPPHQRTTDWIHINGIDEVAVYFLASIEVANARSANGSTSLYFVKELIADVVAALLHLELVEDVGHPLHGFGVRTLSKVIFDASNFDAHPFEHVLS